VIDLFILIIESVKYYQNPEWPIFPACTVIRVQRIVNVTKCPPDFLRTAVVYDLPLMENFRERDPRPPPVPLGFPAFLDFWISDTLQELDPPPVGIIFKMPNWVLQGHQIQENTLAMRAFKVSCILIQNFVRRRYSTLSLTWPVLILDWHLEKYLDAEKILINNFNIPATRAADLLPRLDPKFMGWRVRDEIYRNRGHVHFGGL